MYIESKPTHYITQYITELQVYPWVKRSYFEHGPWKSDESSTN